MWIIILHDSLQVCSISRTCYSILKDVAMLAKAHYKVAKLPSHRGVSVQQLQTNYKAPNFLAALKVFLDSCATRDKVVLPVESDWFEVFNQLYIESGPSIVTRHGRGWQKIHAKPKVTAHGHKVKSPERFDMVFVWDEGHWLEDSFGPNTMYLSSSTWQVCADKYFSNLYRASVCHLQTSRTSRPLPTSTGLCGMVHLTPLL